MDERVPQQTRVDKGGNSGASGFMPWLEAPPETGDDPAADPNKALVAITFDLEMTANFPTWDQVEWNYHKGDLNEASKQYALEAAARVKAHGYRMHDFVLGRALEHKDVDWLLEIAREGHHLGNHTYDHVNLKATRPEDVQYRFQRAPWLIHRRSPQQAIVENIEMTELAMKERLGIEPSGFRTPGGFTQGLADRLDLQIMLLSMGYTWVSSKYPSHPFSKPGEQPGPEVFEGIVKAQAAAQPFIYSSGLIEVPVSPVTEVVAFRVCRWPLDTFLAAIERALEWVIAHGAVFDFVSHPSALGPMDPQFRAIELICETVRKAGSRAAVVDLGTFARRAKLRASQPQP